MILPENEFSHLKGVSRQPYLTVLEQLETVKPVHHISPKDSYFPVFHCSTKNSKMFSSSFLFLQLPLLHSSNRPFTNCQLPRCQDESKCETIHMTSTYRFIRTKTRFETGAQTDRQTFIRELLTGAFDLFLAFIFSFLQHRLFVCGIWFVLLVWFLDSITGGFFTKLPDSVGGAVFLWSTVRSKSDWVV